LHKHPILAWFGRRSGAIISITALAGVVWWATNQGAPRFPDSAEGYALLVGAVVVYGLATVVRGWRWHKIMVHSHVDHKTSDAYALVAVGYMGNTVLPLRGGELLRVVLLGQRSSSPRREILGSIIAERLLDAVALAVLFIGLTLLSVAGAPAGHAAAWIALGALCAASGAIGLYMTMRRRGRLESFSTRMKPFTRATRTLLTGWGALMLLMTALVWGLEGGVFWLVGESLGLNFQLHEGLALVVLASFFAMIPAAPGYVGTYDAAIALGLKGLGIEGGDAVGFTLLARFVVYVPITIVGFGLLVARYGGAGELRLSRLRAESDQLEQRDRFAEERPDDQPAGVEEKSVGAPAP
jgi:hypothetical protein